MRMLISWIFLLSLEVSATFPGNRRSPVINTETGKMRGMRKIYKGCCMDVYYGIPFAKPPMGDLRFRTTVSVKKWDDILDATVKPPACPQVPFDVESLDKESAQSEDCLYLNIWAPCCKKKKAVMVWIHGENFTRGSGSMSLYDGSEIVALGDVIFASINYRLGILGFSFSKTDDAPGNAGMYDQAEALKWIHDNIESFGGDRSSITLFGQNAGSISVSMHTMSPLTSNLFHRAIMQSGSSVLRVLAFTSAANLKATDTVAKVVNCSSSANNIVTQPKAVMDCMKKIDYQVLVDNSEVIMFKPQYGDSFMPNEPRLEIIGENFRGFDSIIGVTGDEGSFYWARKFINIYGRYGEKIQHPTLNKTQARLMITELLSGYAIPSGVLELIGEYYMNKVAGDENEEVLRQAYTAIGDNLILCQNVYEAEKASHKNKIYFYEFDHRQTYTKTGEWTRVTHFTDVPLVFGMPLRQDKLKYQVRFTKAEEDLSRRMIMMWTNFAKGRSPFPNEKSWPRYSREKPCYLKLNTTRRFGIGWGPHRDNCDFLRPYYGFQ